MTDSAPQEAPIAEASEPSAPTASSSGVSPTAAAYVEVWATALGEVVSQIAGRSVTLSALDPASPLATARAETDLCLVVTAAGALRGEMAVRLPAAAAVTAAQTLLGESPNPEAEFTQEYREAAEELLRQAAGQTATALAPRYGEVQLRIEGAPPVTWSSAASGWLSASSEPNLNLQLEWQISAALHAILLTAERGAVAQPATAPPDVHPEPVSPALPEGAKLDVVLEAELEVTLRFGGQTMILRDILDLGPGSVVELDRQVQDPADLLLDGKLIARGEVVVVDGRYGLRVLEVAVPQAS